MGVKHHRLVSAYNGVQIEAEGQIRRGDVDGRVEADTRVSVVDEVLAAHVNQVDQQQHVTKGLVQDAVQFRRKLLHVAMQLNVLVT